MLRAGADKVSVGTAAYDDPSLIEAGARRLGAQCMVVSIDAKRNADGMKNPVTGQNEGISSAYRITAMPAYVCPLSGRQSYHLSADDDGKITDFMVMMRPASTVMAVGAEVAKRV